MLNPQQTFAALANAGLRFEVIEAHKNYRIMRIDVDDTYHPTPEQRAFIDAYLTCVAEEDEETCIAFFAEDAPADGDAFTDKWSLGAYSSIMDAWCVWQRAMDYARSAK